MSNVEQEVPDVYRMAKVWRLLRNPDSKQYEVHEVKVVKYIRETYGNVLVENQHTGEHDTCFEHDLYFDKSVAMDNMIKLNARGK